MIQPVEKESCTFADYLNWVEQDRYEIIYGNAIMMTPPKRIHQEVLTEIFKQIANFLDDKPCKIYPALFGVRLFEQDGGSPNDGCKGAPDMIIEILSPSTMRHDRIVKLNLYRRAGFREYWIADPKNQTVEVYLRDENNDLRPREVYTHKDAAKVTVLEGCTVELGRVFPEEKKILRTGRARPFFLDNHDKICYNIHK